MSRIATYFNSNRRGKYPYDEIDDMIADGFIPVANGDELNALRNTVIQPMGLGTQWYGNYLTGVDKKYIQVRNISLADYQTGGGWNTILWINIYDGNELLIDDVFADKENEDYIGIFRGADYSEIKNMRVKGYLKGKNFVGLCSSRMGQGSKIHNCQGDGIVLAYSYGAIICPNVDSAAQFDYCISKGSVTVQTNYAYGIGGAGYSVEFENNINYATITALGQHAYGIGGGTEGNRNSKNYGNITAGSRYAAGVGPNAKECVNYGSIKGAWAVGGITHQGYVENCFNHGQVESTSQYDSGGLIGINIGVSFNSYNSGLVIGVGVNMGGAVGRNIGSLTNIFYDNQTSGQSDIGKGLPRTTAQMQVGTADSFINPDGSVDILEDPANAMFTTWDNAVWNFGLTNNYPILK